MWRSVMTSVLVAGFAFSGAGCAKKKKADLAEPTPAPAAHEPAYGSQPGAIATAPAPAPVVLPPVQEAPAPAPLAPVPAPAPAPAAPKAKSSAVKASAGGKNYTVQKGDTLWKIAQKHYGSGQKWQEIAKANPSIDPNKLKAGQQIVLP